MAGLGLRRHSRTLAHQGCCSTPSSRSARSGGVETECSSPRFFEVTRPECLSRLREKARARAGRQRAAGPDAFRSDPSAPCSSAASPRADRWEGGPNDRCTQGLGTLRNHAWSGTPRRHRRHPCDSVLRQTLDRVSESWTRTRRPRSGSGSWRSPGSPPPEDLGVSEAGGLS